MAGITALLLGGGLLPLAMAGTASAQNPVGQGFNLNAQDLDFILKQIKIAERHVAERTPEQPCSTMLGPDPDQIPNNGPNGEVLPWGLRTVTGECNNLIAGQEHFGAADQIFPRRVPAEYQDAEGGDPDGPTGPAQTSDPSYDGSGNVVDSEPRLITNLIADQTKRNPAAVAASGLSQEEIDALGPDDTLFIPNTAPDVGLSASFNSVFTLFGQFFDHGLDLVAKEGANVVIPLKADDPLIAGPDGIAGDDPATADVNEGADDLPPSRRFMVVTRSVTPAGPDGIEGNADDMEARNKTTPFVDQQQTYTSHPSHQVFLREYAAGTGGPVSTGHLLERAGAGGMATWLDVKNQARTLLGIELADTDVLSVPMIATDPYGNFLPGPLRGMPQLVMADGVTLVEGDPGAPVPTTGAMKAGHQFLDDIAHHAAPVGDPDRDGAPQALAPDGDTGTGDDRDPFTYDDEMLGAHYVAGDGRVNENVGLTAVHHVFHAEHNRLVEDGDQADDSMDITQLISTLPAEVQAEWQTFNPTSGWDYGERLFQAARFVTEMEYQHLAFEEFARKVQPAINAFGEGGTGYRTDLNPAIKAEFAHAVYRFGHSMLTEVVARTGEDGGANDIGLIPAFLNPPEFAALPPEEAAGQIFRGMSRQVGNEIDEFVTEALRNNLLGLPLDLGAINIARARETGTPGLNAVRRQFHAESANSALEPYESWFDFGQGIKHRESLVNFVAAYGTHPSITSAATMADKRAAAQALVEPPAGTDQAAVDDAQAFMFGTGAYANNADGSTITGVDDIDLWMGGLAEKQQVAGGLLGPTFNYVFELQMEDLQFGDRFYYLARTAGLNLLTQLEGNSFAELISRNTTASGLPADVFSRPAFVFNLANLGTSGAIPDDPATPDWNEAELLVRMPDGTVRYTGPEHVVFNGTADVNRIHSSEGDDTLRGNDGNDRIEGGDGADNFVGGNGDDIMTDFFGDDVLKGGDGNDYLSSGQGGGGDLNQGGRGKDFIVGGNDITETFAGPGDDFVFAGDDLDTVFGDDGNDWIEGGAGPFNLLQGDLGDPFTADPNGGHDVLDADGGEQDYDAEGGHDVMLMGPGIQRAEGMKGWDWTTHKNDPQPANSDMSITGVLPPGIDTFRDRFDLVEALSGWQFDDILRGDNRLTGPVEEDPENTITPEHELNDVAVGLVKNFAPLLGPEAFDVTLPFSAGNILLGGEGSDLIEGREGDDLIDGDVWFDTYLEVRDANGSATRRADSMRELQNDVLAGTLNPGDIHIAREIVTPPPPADPAAQLDTAVFSGNAAEYLITPQPNGTVHVDHLTPVGVDEGTDRVRNVERLQFADQTVDVSQLGTNTPGTGIVEIIGLPTDGPVPEGTELTAERNFTDADGIDENTVVFTWQSQVDGSWVPVDQAGNPGNPFTPDDPAVGFPLRVVVTYLDGDGVQESITSEPTEPVSNVNDAPTGVPTIDNTQPQVGTTVTASTSEIVDADGQPAEYAYQWFRGTTAIDGATGQSYQATQADVGQPLTVAVSYTDGQGTAEQLTSAPTGEVQAAVPAAPAIGTATVSGSTATVNWSAPDSDGGSPITGYEVTVLGADGQQVGALRPAEPSATSLEVSGLTEGEYRFTVRAVNAAGPGASSDPSNAVQVTVDTAPPVITSRTPAAGATGVNRNTDITATFNEPVRESTVESPGTVSVTYEWRFWFLRYTIPVTATVDYDPATRTVTVNPDSTLPANTAVTVTLNSAISDEAGNRMAPTSWRFTTGS